VMTECFEFAHAAIRNAIMACEGIFEREGLPVIEVDVSEWHLGFDVADGGSTASVVAVVDGELLVCAAVGDTAAVLAVPSMDASATRVEELVAEHSPMRIDEWESRLRHAEVHVVYDHPELFDGPEHLINVFCKDPHGRWQHDEQNMHLADEAGCGFKTERGDRSVVIITPKDGLFTQMTLNVTRSLGDFYHQRYGVTWKPEVVCKDISELMGRAQKAVVCVASDGVWDLWRFEEAMEELLAVHQIPRLDAKRRHVIDFFEATRMKGADFFGESQDNLTGIVIAFTGEEKSSKQTIVG